MAIQSKFRGGGNRISVPGEYVVEITKASAGMSKSNKPMLTVTFQNFQQEEISGYYLRELHFHMIQLKELKEACGLDGGSPAENLVGKNCGILVEAGNTDDKGRTFMQITGYGKASDVSSQPLPHHDPLASGGSGKSGF
jgi:hypothetical protein